MKKSFLFFFIFISISCFAQFSKTHYIPPVSHSDAQEPQEQVMYISSPSIIPINFQVKTPIGGILFTGTVSRDDPYVYTIGSGNDTQFMIDKSDVNTIKNNKGFIVEAEDLVYVTVRVVATTDRYQAGSIVSKGQAALGKHFRIGAFTNMDVTNTSNIHYTFATILATENTTTISFGDIKTGVSLINNATVGNTPSDIILNRGESFAIAVEGPNDANRDGLIGASITSDKPIAVNCGSFGGSNSTGNLDLGMDQIVSAERTGTEYIFIKGNGIDLVEKPIIVANENFTDVFLNGSTTALTTLSAGKYIALNGADFSAKGNLYVTTSKKAFAYQGIGGTSEPKNQNLHFVPPLNCGTPKIINNIPLINTCGNDNSFTGTVCIVTKTGSTLNFIIDAIPYSLATLPSTSSVTGPSDVTGNNAYKTYTISGLTGNVSVFSTSEVYLSYFGSSGAATYGGFYSGFTFDPEITFGTLSTTASGCIPNVNLSVNTLSSFDSFKWFKDGVFNGNTASSYTPTAPGYYYVAGQISACGILSLPYNSVEIPVSSCPTNMDNDVANDNIDVDNDNDGITNCTESYGSQNINILNPAAGTITVGTSYSNSFTGAISTIGTGLPIGTFTGNLDGSFISEVPAGKGNSITYKMTFFTKPISVGIEYVSTSNPIDLLNADAEYVVNSEINKTITVLNPTNQLLIDTNYDGIYESGITEYSSFEIRFRLNSTTPLAAGTGTFKFLTYLANSISFTHRNLSDDLPNRSTLKFFAACIPKDSDLDGIADQLDSDSDNDGIPDIIEAQTNASVVLSNTDTNNDGLDNAFEPGLIPVDTDNDGVLDYLDLDSDNDGIYDLVETEIDTDADGIRNYRDLDSDKDLCSDVIEAGFTDANNDGEFGNSPITVDLKGLVIGAPYTTPNPYYLISAPIVITNQPNVAPTCELENATITLVDNCDTYQWQLFTGGSWIDIVDNVTYSGSTTNTLLLTSVTNAMNGNKYRVQLNKTGNSCGLISDETALVVYALPVVIDVTIIQCDDDLDLKTLFNLTIKNDLISANAINETFSYYKTPAGADAADVNQLISNYTTFPNTTSPMNVWVRVVNNANNCFSVAKLTLRVVGSQFPPTYSFPVPPVCDDTLAADGTATGDPNTNKRDGISAFDLTNAIYDVESQLPTPLSDYTIKYYRNKADGLAQNDVSGISLAIKPIEYTNFRNDIPYAQNIWVRVNNNLTSDCGYGFGDFIKLSVEKLPFANPVLIPRQCDDNQDGTFTFYTLNLEDTLKGTNQTSPVTVTYFDTANNPLKDSNGVLITTFPATFTTTSQIIKAVVTNNTLQKCYDETLIEFKVDKIPTATLPFTDIRIECDDEDNPLNQNGVFKFITPKLESDILGTQTNVSITYFDDLGNPLLDILGNPIISPFPNTFETKSRTIKAVVTSTITNTSCPSKSVNIPFVVLPLPNINLNTNGDEDEFVCSNNPTFYVQLDAGIQDGSSSNNYTYNWTTKDGNVLFDPTAYTLDVYTEGTYTVEVKNKVSGCSRIRTIKVTASDIAHILSIAIVDMNDVNTVTVNVTGTGNYEYSLDEPSGYFQDSNFFNNVPAGIHDVYINDKNGCGPVTKATIAVVGVPKFFTPNSDGYNDYWSVKGVNANFNANSIIYIFDRYGNLLKQWVSSSSEGWDGTFNGTSLPSDDYWYTIKLEDGREAKGHFSLKR